MNLELRSWIGTVLQAAGGQRKEIMLRHQVHELVKNLPGGDMIAAVTFISYLCGSKPSDHLQFVVERLYAGDYEDLGKCGEIEPWEADEREARSHLQLLIESVREEDLYTAGRFLEYLVGGGGPAVPAGHK